MMYVGTWSANVLTNDSVLTRLNVTMFLSQHDCHKVFLSQHMCKCFLLDSYYL